MLLDYLGETVADPKWWFDQAAAFIIFTLLAGFVSGWVSSRLQQRAERRAREPYEGWKLEIVGFGDDPEPLYWEDVKRYDASEFERWKWVKSICSGLCMVNARSAKHAEKQGWLKFDKEGRRVVIDFVEMDKGGHAHEEDWRVARPWCGETKPPERRAKHGPR